ncbi:MAG: hypothetical protein U5L45_02455 [Saprospiraceae bacterium]|nr:hypothetical protein [Saprospiraceae bacterium]
MKRISTLAAVAAVVLFMACQGSPKFENCGGQPTCPPPTDANAPEDLKKLRENIAGKWKLVRINTIDTFHKTAGAYTDLDRSICLGYAGSVQYFREDRKLSCGLCYELSKKEDKYEFTANHSNMNKFCLESVQSGEIKYAGDSLVIINLDSFVIKRAVYRRMDDNGHFKGN